MPILYALPEAAKALGGISVWTLRKHVTQGRVRVTRIGRRVFIDADELTRIRREGLPSIRAEAGYLVESGPNANLEHEDA